VPPLPLQVGTGSTIGTASTQSKEILAANEPTSFILSFPTSNNDFVSIALSMTDAATEKVIPCYPGSKLIVRKFVGHVFAQANSGTQGYFLFIMPNNEEPFEYVSDVAGLASSVVNAAGLYTGPVGNSFNLVIQTNGAGELALLFTSNNLTFNGQTVGVQVSPDGVNFYTVDGITLTTNLTTVGKQYDITHLAGTIPVNPAAFPYVKLQVPVITNSSVTVVWGGKLS
jgi:hypothetical protein